MKRIKNLLFLLILFCFVGIPTVFGEGEIISPGGGMIIGGGGTSSCNTCYDVYDKQIENFVYYVEFFGSKTPRMCNIFHETSGGCTLGNASGSGATFVGWVDDYGNDYDTDYVVCCNMAGRTFHAKFEVTVTFDGNGGTASKTTMTVEKGKAIGTLPTATRSGYTFNGWYTAKTGGTKISSSTTVSANTTYYAHWTEKQKDSDGGKEDDGSGGKGSYDDGTGGKSSQEVSDTPKTGDALIYVALLVGFGALGYAIYYFIKYNNERKKERLNV